MRDGSTERQGPQELEDGRPADGHAGVRPVRVVPAVTAVRKAALESELFADAMEFVAVIAAIRAAATIQAPLEEEGMRGLVK